MWRIKPPPTGGRFSSTRCPYLCSPFLDSAAACKPAPLTTLHSVIATIVARVCSGWNHRPAVSLVCATCQRTYLLSSFAEGERFELPKRFAACLVSSEVLSSTQPTFQICLILMLDCSFFVKPAGLADGRDSKTSFLIRMGMSSADD